MLRSEIHEQRIFWNKTQLNQVLSIVLKALKPKFRDISARINVRRGMPLDIQQDQKKLSLVYYVLIRAVLKLPDLSEVSIKLDDDAERLTYRFELTAVFANPLHELTPFRLPASPKIDAARALANLLGPKQQILQELNEDRTVLTTSFRFFTDSPAAPSLQSLDQQLPLRNSASTLTAHKKVRNRPQEG